MFSSIRCVSCFFAFTIPQCPNPEPFVDRTFRGGKTSATNFQLSVLTNRHPDYVSLKEQFVKKWQKPKPALGVSVWRIFKVKVRSFLISGGTSDSTSHAIVADRYPRTLITMPVRSDVQTGGGVVITFSFLRHEIIFDHAYPGGMGHCCHMSNCRWLIVPCYAATCDSTKQSIFLSYGPQPRPVRPPSTP